MTAQELAKLIVKHVAKNAWRESRFLYPNPQWNVSAHTVMELIEKEVGVTAAQIDAWCDEAHKERTKL